MACISIAVAASAVGMSAATAAGAFSPGTPAAPNVGAMTADQINAMIAETPANYQAQQTYNPKFAALNSNIAWQNLFGTPGTPATPGTATQTTIQAGQAGWYDAQGNFLGARGLYNQGTGTGRAPGVLGIFGGNMGHNSDGGAPPAGAVLYQHGQNIRVAGPTTAGTPATPASPGQLALMEAAAPRVNALSAQANTAQRTASIADVQNLGPAAYQAMRGYDPAVTGLLDSMNSQVQERLATKGAPDPFQQMALEQNYRSGEAARGLAGGTGDAAMEAYYKAATQNQMQLQNINLAGQVAGQEAGYYGDPFQQVLSRTSGGAQIPQVNTTANQGSATQNTAGLLNSGLTSIQSNGYTAGIGAQNAAYMQQQQGIASLTSPSALSSYQTLANYFSSPSLAGVGGGT